jgi:hypothetical protein
MKKIFLIGILSFVYFLSFGGNVVKVQLDDSDIIINEEGEVIIDGVKYSEEAIDEVMENNTVVNINKDPSNIYRSKNVDSYNEWYNKNIKDIKAKRCKKKKEIKKIIFNVLGFIGLIFCLIAGFMITRSLISSRNKKYKEEDTPSVKPSGSGLEVIGSAIKNDKYQGSTGTSV